MIAVHSDKIPEEQAQVHTWRTEGEALLNIYSGNAKAITHPAGDFLFPATDTAIYCLPLLI